MTDVSFKEYAMHCEMKQSAKNFMAPDSGAVSKSIKAAAFKWCAREPQKIKAGPDD